MAIGYRVVSYNLEEMSASTLEFRNPVDLNKGSIHTSEGGLYLGSSEGFCEYYLGNTDDHDVILTLEYDENDLLLGESGGDNEIRVKEATLVGARFYEEDIQRRFGQLLNPQFIEQRRTIMRGSAVGPKHGKTSLLRAMGADIQHIFPMDYAYTTLPVGVLAAERAMKLYEDEVEPRTQTDRALLNAINHAVTTAIYEGEPQHVTTVIVSSDKVFEAQNPGEYFYDAERAVMARSLIIVDSDGQLRLSHPEKSKHNERDLNH